MAGTYVTGDKGILAMKAGRNVNLKAADIGVAGEDSKATIKAGKDINMDTVKAGSSNDIVFDKDNYRHDKTSSDVGTSIQTEGGLALEAGRDMNATAAYVKAGKELNVKAGKDINIKAGESDISVISKQEIKPELKPALLWQAKILISQQRKSTSPLPMSNMTASIGMSIK